MPDLPQVTVITPTLGRSRWLDQTVASVAAFRSARDALGHTLVAPSDRVGALTARYPEVMVVPEPKTGGGLYEAVNYGARINSGWQWLTYLNDDDRLQPGFERLLDAARQAEADIIYGRVSYIDDQGRALGSFPVEARPRRLAALMRAGIPPLTQQGTLIGRDCFDRLGGFDPRYRLAADYDFWVRAVVNGAAFVHIPAHAGSFRLRADQLSVDQEKVRDELASIHGRHLPTGGRWSDLLVRMAFRCRHFSAILTRRKRTGRWRTVDSVGRLSR
jgi:GT2 family glycosyltransferase